MNSERDVIKRTVVIGQFGVAAINISICFLMPSAPDRLILRLILGCLSMSLIASGLFLSSSSVMGNWIGRAINWLILITATGAFLFLSVPFLSVIMMRKVYPLLVFLFIWPILVATMSACALLYLNRSKRT